MKNRLKSVTLMMTFMVIVLLVTNTNITYAYVLLGGWYDESRDMKWWRDSSVTGYGDRADHGSNAWDGSYYIETSETSNASNAQLKWYASTNNFEDGVYADTLNYDVDYYGAVRACWSCEYDKSRIRINIPEFKNLSYSNQLETVAHEVGHAFGLDHEDDVTCIMLTTRFSNYNWPSQDDWNGIVNIYSNK